MTDVHLRGGIPISDILERYSEDKFHRALRNPAVGVGYPDAPRTVVEATAIAIRLAVKRGLIVDIGTFDYAGGKKTAEAGMELVTHEIVRAPFGDPWMVRGDVSFIKGQDPKPALVICSPANDNFWVISELAITRQNVVLAWYSIGVDPVTGGFNVLGETGGAMAGRPTDPSDYAVGYNMVMASVALLNTRGLDWHTRPTIRDRKGDTVKPGSHRLRTPYFTYLRNKASERGEGKGGTHASPIPHIRSGHVRTFKDGKPPIFIRPMAVNVKGGEEASLMERIGYRVRPRD